VDFADAKADEHMTPLVDVASLPHTSGLPQAVRLIHERGFSRIPIFADRVDNITGIVEAMDLIDASPGGDISVPVHQAAVLRARDGPHRRPAGGVPPDAPGDGRRGGRVWLRGGGPDARGRCRGDRGDVFDEFDRPGKAGFERSGRWSVHRRRQVQGWICSKTSWVFACHAPATRPWPDSRQHLFQKVPKAGETLEQDGLKITIIDASQRTSERVKSS